MPLFLRGSCSPPFPQEGQQRGAARSEDGGGQQQRQPEGDRRVCVLPRRHIAVEHVLDAEDRAPQGAEKAKGHAAQQDGEAAHHRQNGGPPVAPVFRGQLADIRLAGGGSVRRGPPDQLVQGDAEEIAQQDQPVQVRRRGVQLPFGDGLPGDVQPFRQLFLRQPGGGAKLVDALSQCHEKSSLRVICSQGTISRQRAARPPAAQDALKNRIALCLLMVRCGSKNVHHFSWRSDNRRLQHALPVRRALRAGASHKHPTRRWRYKNKTMALFFMDSIITKSG